MLTLKELIIFAPNDEKTKREILRQLPTMTQAKKEALEIMCWTVLKQNFEANLDQARKAILTSYLKSIGDSDPRIASDPKKLNEIADELINKLT